MPAIGFWSGAVDYPVHMQLMLRPRLSVAQADFHVVVEFSIPCESAGVKRGLPLALKTRDRIANVGSDAMAVNFPVSPNMAQKPSSLIAWQ
jgi:hypothetical protein